MPTSSSPRLAALATLARHLAADRTGSVLEPALEALRGGLSARGVLAYRVEDRGLALAADQGVPPAARSELSRLELDGDFAAQRAAREVRTVVDEGPAQEGVHAALLLAGWSVLVAAPIAVGRHLKGVLLVGLDNKKRLGSDGVLLLEAVAAMSALSMDRERGAQRDRDERGADELAARFATVGMVSTAGALDIAVPLSAMMVQLETLERALATLREAFVASFEESEALEDAEAVAGNMGDGLRHALGIASHLLELSRQSRPAPVDLTLALDATLALLRSKLEASGLSVTMTGDEQPLLVDGRAESLQALLVQTLLHAMELCSAAGTRDGTIDIHLSSDGARHVIEIETASGDPKKRRAFDAFVRRQLHGPAGLSLSLAAQAAVAHEGHIEIGTSERGGARIDVVLPASRTRPRPRGRLALADEREEGQTIVVVGDDGALVASLEQMLPLYRVRAVSTVEEAYATLVRMRPLPDMVLCDVSLPDGTGVELHQRVKPELQSRFVFSTKGVLAADVAEYLRSSSCPTLLRPIAPEEIRSLLSDDDGISGAPTLIGTRRRDTNPNLFNPARDRQSARSAQRRRTATQTDTPIAKTRSRPPERS